MLDLEKCKQRQHQYWSEDSTVGPNTLNGFAGTFNYTDPARVPELFRNLAVEYFGLERYRSVKLDRLNDLVNELWEGPGSCAKISDVIWDIRIARRVDPTAPRRDPLKGYATPTIDDYVATQADDGPVQ